MELTEVIEGRSFTVVSKVPMFRMQFNHEIEPNTNNVKVTHRVKLEGLLLIFIGNRLACQIDKGLPESLTNLKALAERDVEIIISAVLMNAYNNSIQRILVSLV